MLVLESVSGHSSLKGQAMFSIYKEMEGRATARRRKDVQLMFEWLWNESWRSTRRWETVRLPLVFRFTMCIFTKFFHRGTHENP